ncbi:MAG: glutamine--fructose-6-phosphate transaminase (isomerizing) [Solirubrobacteraceae bacterium]
MCGIIGYIGYRQVQDLLMDGLTRLEYRGYDSAGMAWVQDGRVERVRAVGNLESLRVAMMADARARVGTPVGAGGSTQPTSSFAEANVGIGHTRWATHGGVTVENAHPHCDGSGRIWIVLNGIIENYVDLRRRLERDLVQFSSQTDAEVLAHLIAIYYDGDLVRAVQRACDDLRGHYAFVALSLDEPDRLVASRHECPLVIGLGDGEQFIASSIAAFLPHTRAAALLRDGELAVVHAEGVTLIDIDGVARPPTITEVDWGDDRMEKEGFETYMLKEIHEQPVAVHDTLSSVHAEFDLANPRLSRARLREFKHIRIVACGTSFHAALAGKLAIERWARIPVEVDVASEFRYQDPIVAPGTLVVGISQSGETADTLAAMRLARDRGATVLAITNVPGSQATRDADAVLFTRAGIELGVAATKTFVAQVALLYVLALELAAAADTMPAEQRDALRAELERLPESIEWVLKSAEHDARELAGRLLWSPFFLYLGRLTGLPVALEGALKLKEISYVPTDAYPAGEMKHGPIALLSRETPVIAVATDESVLPKLCSNLEEVRARGAWVLAVASEGFEQVAEHAEHVFYVPRTDPLMQIVLAIVPLQLFAYHLARGRGLNVDQPRNLAKTVTVE